MNDEVRTMLARAISSYHDTENRIIEAEAQKNPVAYKDCKVFRNGMNFRYYTGVALKKKNKVYFCYTVKTNVAGYYVTFTEMHIGKMIKRVNFHGWKTRKDAREYCLMRARDTKKPKDQRKFTVHA